MKGTAVVVVNTANRSNDVLRSNTTCKKDLKSIPAIKNPICLSQTNLKAFPQIPF